jgi:arabinofuranosyltransferase
LEIEFMHPSTSQRRSAPGASTGLLMGSLPVIALLGLFLVIILRRAWVGDDAYITFRTVDNLIHGYSLTWNPGERVQAYTHPLWMFTLSFFYFFTHEIYFTSVFVSLAISLSAAALFAARVARSTLGAVLGILVLTLSNAFVDYSTSGLENPLTHLLLVVFFVLYFSGAPSPRRLFWLSGVASLAAVNRQDTLLLYLPALFYSWWQLPDRRKGILPAVLGQAPLLVWEVFSVVYYGFPFPNTAYAKLNTGLASGDLLVQGLFYLLNSIDHDPLTLMAVAGGVLLAFAGRKRRELAVAAGIGLYLVYILKIGGDFMSGRFLTAPLFCAVALIGQADFRNLQPAAGAGLFGVVLAAGLLAPLPTYRVDIPSSYSLSDAKRINDERAWYFRDVNLLGRSRVQPYPTSQGRQGGLAARAQSQKDYLVVPVNNIGLYGYYAGPKVYIIDEYALADPLLARLPAEREANFYIGHFHRRVPDGYIPSVYSGKNRLTDPDLAKYYDQLRLIVRGKLFDPQRWAAIWKMNTGQLNGLIHTDAYRYPDLLQVDLSQASQPGGLPSPAQFGDSGVEVRLGQVLHAPRFEVELDSRADFEVVFRSGEQTVGTARIYGTYSGGGVSTYTVETPAGAAQAGFDALHILPLGGSELESFQMQGLRVGK